MKVEGILSKILKPMSKFGELKLLALNKPSDLNSYDLLVCSDWSITDKGNAYKDIALILKDNLTIEESDCISRIVILNENDEVTKHLIGLEQSIEDEDFFKGTNINLANMVQSSELVILRRSRKLKMRS